MSQRYDVFWILTDFKRIRPNPDPAVKYNSDPDPGETIIIFFKNKLIANFFWKLSRTPTPCYTHCITLDAFYGSVFMQCIAGTGPPLCETV
jgi:hypothetical protein